MAIKDYAITQKTLPWVYIALTTYQAFKLRDWHKRHK